MLIECMLLCTQGYFSHYISSPHSYLLMGSIGHLLLYCSIYASLANKVCLLDARMELDNHLCARTFIAEEVYAKLSVSLVGADYFCLL